MSKILEEYNAGLPAKTVSFSYGQYEDKDFNFDDFEGCKTIDELKEKVRQHYKQMLENKLKAIQEAEIEIHSAFGSISN